MQEDQDDVARATEPPGATERRSLLQNALSAIERLQAKIAASEAARHEPIAIVGMACRIPGGAEDPDAFWKLLAEGQDAVTEVPRDRWDVDAYYDPDPKKLGKARTKAGGFLRQLDGFEPGFFGMSPREATGLDPQQRLLLEVAWEALEHAGIPADQLDGSRTGVFVGITSTDYAQRIDVADPLRSDIYLATGTALNAAAGRISFTFGFRGPCMAIDTACSSSLVALHTACQSLRNRESDLVLAGGVNCILSPDPFVLISKWGMLSPDGRCKTFDASANGFVRGEGCGLLVLERASDAQRNGHRILALIPGSAINQDGRSSGLTVPNGLAQQEVIRQALAAARLKPNAVSYVEAHGTGTSLGDPIEVEALAAVYGVERPVDAPLELGSVKSNIGHLEAASGVVSVIKLVLALQHGQLPASLHVRHLTPAIPWERLPVRVSTRLHDWQAKELPRIAGVSAFGFSGMNAHMLVQEAPQRAPTAGSTSGPDPTRRPFTLPLSARSEAALTDLAGRYADHIERRVDQDLADVCATAACGRTHLPWRAVILGEDRAGMIGTLRDLARNEGTAVRGFASSNGRPKVAFLFTGQGSQYVGMGRELDACEGVFRSTLDRCAAVLDPLLGRSLRTVMFDSQDGSLDQTGYTQPAIFALQVSLAAQWRSWGVEPSSVIGHSVGEFAAAVVAGVLTLEDGARLIAVRAGLMQSLPTGGAMVSVQGDVAAVAAELATVADAVSIAAVNGPENVVISGAATEVQRVAARLAARGARTQALDVSHAFHSPLMEPMVEAFRASATGVQHQAPRVTWISTLLGAPLDWSEWGRKMAEYWTRHVLAPVAFQDGMTGLRATGCSVLLEIGPHPTLIGLGRQCLPSASELAWLPSLRRGRDAWATLHESIAQLHVQGCRFDWSALLPTAAQRCIELPTYPFQRQPYMVPFVSERRSRASEVVHELLGERREVAGVRAQFERLVDSTCLEWLPDHRIASEVVMPLTAFLEACLAAVRSVSGAEADALESLEVRAPMPLRQGERRAMQVVVDEVEGDGSLRVRVFSRLLASKGESWELHVTARAPVAGRSPPSSPDATDLSGSKLERTVDAASFYEKLRETGADFGPSFRCMKSVQVSDGEAIGEIEPSDEVGADIEKYNFHPALLDACFHVSAVAMDSLPGDDGSYLYLPIGVDRYRFWGRPRGPLRSHAKIRPPAVRGEMLAIDVHVETADGAPVATLHGLQCRRASRDMFRRGVEAQVPEWLYELKWSVAAGEASVQAEARGVWLILDDGGGRGERLSEGLMRKGARVQRAMPRDVALDGAIGIDPASPSDYAALLERTASLGPLAGVVTLWPLRLKALGAGQMPSEVQAMGTDSLLLLVQSLAKAPLAEPARLCIVTAGSQFVDGTESLRLEQAPVAGLARVAATEHPDLRVTLFDLDPQGHVNDVGLMVDELTKDGERLVAWRKGMRYVARLAHRVADATAITDDAPSRLGISSRGTLENLALEPMRRTAPKPGEVELRVHASGLNFRDVLSALGMYPGELRHLGSDCAGEITAVGEGVTRFKPGDRVVAMAEGAFASHAVTRWEFVAPLPDGLDYEQGAAIPTAYLTADITLNLIGKLKRGDKVLIHSGAGGVGMAAIALARNAGAEIFATAGSAEKRATLSRLGVHHVLDSRSTSFADELMRLTDGRGVDIVLNSLAGEMLQRSFDCVADGGIFLEIGKRGVWTQEQVAALGRGIRYHVVDCNDNARETPELVGEIFARVLGEISSGVLPPLPLTTFLYERAAEAFRFMAQAKHIGRVVFRHRVERRATEKVVEANGSYLVTGGLGGLGLLAARFLVDSGARHILLVGRRAPDAVAAQAIAGMGEAGAQVDVALADLSEDGGIETIMRALRDGRPGLRGVIHAAGVLDDGVLANQTRDKFVSVMRPKADGAWRLHLALETHGIRPDFFVLYSSLSAMFGSAGQGNYVAANAFLDSLARYRRARGLVATSIGWGAWSDVGMAARGSTVARAGAQGLKPLSPSDGLAALNHLLRSGVAHVGVAPIDWSLLAEQLRGGAVPSLLKDLVASANKRDPGSSGSQARRTQRIDFGQLDATTRLAELVTVVRRELATVLGLTGTIDSIAPDQPFSTLGLDSLTAVELRNRLQQAVGQSVKATAAFEWPTVSAMAQHLHSLFGQDAEERDPASEQTASEVREELKL